MKTLATITAGAILGILITGTAGYIAMTFTDGILEYL